jgi:hypothetical protein
MILAIISNNIECQQKSFKNYARYEAEILSKFEGIRYTCKMSTHAL